MLVSGGSTLNDAEFLFNVCSRMHKHADVLEYICILHNLGTLESLNGHLEIFCLCTALISRKHSLSACSAIPWAWPCCRSASH